MNRAKLPANLVFEACQAFLNDYDRRVSEKREPLIQKEMKGNWFFKPMTREEAIKSLKNGDNFSEYYMIRFHESDGVWEIENLMSLAQISGKSEITVDSQTASYLVKFWPKS